MKLTKLDLRGVAHHFLMMLVVVSLGVGGVYELVASHAATPEYYAHIASASCTSISAAAHDALKPKNHVQIDVQLSGGATADLGRHQVAGSDLPDTYTWSGSQIPAALTNSTSTVYLTEVVYDTDSAGNLVPVKAATPAGDSQTASISGGCKKTSTGSTGGTTSTPPTVSGTHAYHGHIVTASCTSISAAGQDADHPANHVQIDVLMSGGAKGDLGKVQVAGGGSDTTTWPTPASIKNSTTKVYLAEAIYDTNSSGALVDVTSQATPPAGDTMTMTVGPCASTASSGSSGSNNGSTGTTTSTTTSTTTAAHQYEAHFTTITCNSIGIEAHDSGTSPDGKLTVTVNMSGGPYSQASAIGPHAVNAQNEYVWVTPTAIQNYDGNSNTTFKLAVSDNGKAVTLANSPTAMSLGACDQPSAAQQSQATIACLIQNGLPNNQYFDVLDPAGQKLIQDCAQRLALITVQQVNARNGVTSVLTQAQIQNDLSKCQQQYAAGSKNRNQNINTCVEQLELKQDPLLTINLVAPKPAPKQSIPKKFVDGVQHLVHNITHPFGVGTPCVNKVLQSGDSGGCVKAIQALVDRNVANANLKVTGKFNSDTESAVQKFQNQGSWIPTDGIVGPQTWYKLCIASKGKSGFEYGYSVSQMYKDAGCAKVKKPDTSVTYHQDPSSNGPGGSTTPSTTSQCPTGQVFNGSQCQDREAAYQGCVAFTKALDKGKSQTTLDKDLNGCAQRYGNSTEKKQAKDKLGSDSTTTSSNSTPCGQLSGQALKNCQQNNNGGNGIPSGSISGNISWHFTTNLSQNISSFKASGAPICVTAYFGGGHVDRLFNHYNMYIERDLGAGFVVYAKSGDDNPNGSAHTLCDNNPVVGGIYRVNFHLHHRANISGNYTVSY